MPVVAALGAQVGGEREVAARASRWPVRRQRAAEAEVRVVVDRVALDHGLELARRLGVAAAAEVGAAERLADRGLLRRQPRRLRERHRGLREVARPRAATCRGGRARRESSDASAIDASVGPVQCGAHRRLGPVSAALVACSRSASTRSRIASATSSLDASGTSTLAVALDDRDLVARRSRSRSPARETSLKTIASSPLRSSFARARSIASGAVLGREADQRLAVAPRAPRARPGRPRSARGAGRGRRCPRARSSPPAARPAGSRPTAAAISSTWQSRELARARAAGELAPRSRRRSGRTPAGSGSATLAATRVTSRAPPGGRARRARSPSARSSGCR